MRYRAGPRALWLLRHGQSDGNVARDRAEQQGLHRIDVASRDADVPLSPLGVEQARAFGRWMADQSQLEQPTVVVASPYVRALQTARLALDGAGLGVELDVDERLRDREMGWLDMLTWHGIQALHPDEAERALRLGRFFYRPPGGESWADLVLRLRSLLADIAREMADERVLLVMHDLPIQLICALIDGLDEQQTIDLVVSTDYANCGLTRYVHEAGGYRQLDYNFTLPVLAAGTSVTEESDVPAGPR